MKEKKIKYGCGHESGAIIVDCNSLSILALLEWKDTVGIDGDKSMCFDCWCKKQKKKIRRVAEEKKLLIQRYKELREFDSKLAEE